MPRPKKNMVSDLPLIKKEDKEDKKACIACGSSKQADFYGSCNDAHKIYNKLPWCKSCVEKKHSEYLQHYGDGKLAIYFLCRKFDIFYADSAYEGARNSNIKTGMSILGSYFKQINSFRIPNNYGTCFDESWDFLDLKDSDENKTEEDIKEKKVIKKISLSAEDKKAQSDILRLLGYDPFLDYEMIDKVFLCNDLVSYLDEDTVEDAYKCSVVLQIVNNNNQIRKIDIAINQLSSDIDSIVKNSKDIDGLTSIKQKLNQANDKLSKENSIALKHRDGNGTQNSTLGSTMKKLRELGFDKAEHDYYDMNKSFGIRQTADISNKSILDILHFDDNDVNNMFKMQREELQKLQDKELDYKEQIRVLIKENNELKIK